MSDEEASKPLTPAARKERAARIILEGLVELIDAEVARSGSANDWIDQNHSPLKKRKHLDLARTGALPSRKLGNQVLILRKHIDAYIEREGLARGKDVDDEDVTEALDGILAATGTGKGRKGR